MQELVIIGLKTGLSNLIISWKTMRESTLKRRYIFKLFANAVSAIIGAIVLAIAPKALGSVAYGQFIYLQDFFTKVIGFIDMGSSTAFFAKLSARQNRKELIGFYFAFSYIVFITIALFIYAGYFLGFLQDVLPDIPLFYIVLGLFFGFLTWFVQIYTKISDAYAMTVSYEIIRIAHKVVTLLLLVSFVYYLSFNLELYFYFHYISLISFLLLISFAFVKKRIFQDVSDFKFSFLTLAKEFWLYCHPLAIFSVFSLLSGFFQIWLLQKVAGSEQTGFYGLAYGLSSVCFLFTGAMTPLIIREFSKYYEENRLDNMREIFYRYIPMLYSISAFFSVFISMQSKNILLIFTDNGFSNAYPALLLMSYYPIHQTYGQLSGGIFYATSQTKLYRNIGVFSSLLSIVLSFIFIYIFDLGAMGMSINMLITHLIIANIQLYFNSKFLKLNIKYFIFHQIYSVAFFCFFAFFVAYFININNPICDLVFSGFLYIILVTIFTYVFPQVFAVDRYTIKKYFYKAKQYVFKEKINKQ